MIGEPAPCDNDMVIRLATSSDDILSIAVESGINGLSEQRAIEILETAIAKAECVVYVGDRDAVDGFAVIHKRTFFGRDFVKLIAVRATARRQGIGRLLLRHACATALTGTVFISTNQSNTAMRQMLGREHWVFSGRLTGIDDADPELVFYKATI